MFKYQDALSLVLLPLLYQDIDVLQIFLKKYHYDSFCANQETTFMTDPNKTIIMNQPELDGFHGG